jgi:hypothetical protein
MHFFQRRWGILAAIALAGIVLLTLISAPNNADRIGSTYNRAPSGYGAWYAYMQAQGTTIERWQKPLSELLDATPSNTNQTLIRARSRLQRVDLDTEEREWVSRGNTLISLGHYQPATAATFRKALPSPVGAVKIETTRRATDIKTHLLGDRLGAVVWLERIGEGQAIYATTPHLAANAYQDSPGNFAFLAFLATQQNPQDTRLIQNARPQIWIDEYIHGYQDTVPDNTETQETLWQYWLKTPMFPAVIQGLVVLAIVLLASNRRFGQTQPLAAKTVNNSQAYIEALAGVLQKAECSEFVLETVGKEEQRQLQQALGLGNTLLEVDELLEAVAQQTQQSPQELKALLRVQSPPRRLSTVNLGRWYLTWQSILAKKPSR